MGLTHAASLAQDLEQDHAMTNPSRLDRLFQAMPPVAAMQVRALDFDGHTLRLSAPLAANVNDKACAFGGSLAGVMTLAGWGWLMLAAEDAGLSSEVYIADSQVRYLAPLFDDLVAEACLRPGQDWAAILRTLAERRRVSASMLTQVVSADGTVVATLEARFALKRVAAP
jgi:thioesterase domain-containing protein